MYREMATQAQCVFCGVQQPLERMEFAPQDGQWCWQCKVTAQIALHTATPTRQRAAARRQALFIGGVLAGVLFFVYALLAVASVVHGC